MRSISVDKSVPSANVRALTEAISETEAALLLKIPVWDLQRDGLGANSKQAKLKPFSRLERQWKHYSKTFAMDSET